MVKILLSGCCGKMGTVISNLVNEFPNLEIIGGIDKFPQELSYPIFKTPEEVNIEYDVLLDFSNVSTLHGLLKLTEKLAIVYLYQLQFCLRRLECLSSRFFLIRVIGKR